MNDLTKIHAADVMSIMNILFPKGFDGLIAARRESIMENKTTIYIDKPELKVLGGTVKIEVTFKP